MSITDNSGWGEVERKARRHEKSLRAGEWFGCGRKITTESWEGFLKALKAYYEALDKHSKAKTTHDLP